ncbi:MAG: prepilin peptidase [Dehalococcoidia bacterium]|nr:prepilin peptidase [Dehalococcoidia bacterium]
MDWLASALFALVGLAFGWVAPRYQHLLYRDPAHRAQPATGRKLLALRLFAAIASSLALLLAFRPEHYEAGPAFLTAAFLLVLVVLSSTDFERRIIPNRLVYPALAAAAAVCWAWPDRTIGDIALGTAIAFGIAALLFLAGLFAGGLGAFGMGDVKLIVLIGLLTGWPLALTALFIGMVAAGVPSLALILAGRGRSYFSYGPYLALGAALALLFPSLA